MKARVVLVEDWPQPDTVSSAVVAMAGSKLTVGYGTGEGEYVIVFFPRAADLKAGGTNDEVLHGHPLYGLGLKHYSIHRIENSPWLSELEQQNSIHDRHDKRRFLQDKVHYLFALKEETVECIVIERADSPPRIEIFRSQESALKSIKWGVDA